jgi:multiple sugar transport system substrate-binding protein
LFVKRNNPTKLKRSSGQSNLSAIHRRDFLKWIGTASAATVLASCSPGTQPEGPHGSGRVQLVYQDWRTDWFPKLAQNMLEKFYEDHPNFQVFYTPDPENLDEQMLADFQSGTAPDVLAGCCDFFPGWAQQGYLLDLKPFVEADLDRSVINDWDPAQYKSLFTEGGVQYALPKYHGALGLYFNKDLFDAYHVDYPDGSWNHDDYVKAMKLLTHDRSGDGDIDLWGSMIDISWERIQVHVNGWGGHFVNPKDPTKSLMGRLEALDAMRWIRDRLWEDHTYAGSLDVRNLETRQAFIQGHVAMVEDGSWALKDILEGADFRIGVAPFPSGPAKKVTLATTDGFGIYAGTKYPEASWELLKFLISKDYGRAMAQAHFLQPARSSLVEEWIDFIRQEYPFPTREMDLQFFAESHIQNYSVTAEIFRNMPAARRLTQEAWQRIFTVGQEPVERMVEVSHQIELAQRSDI